MNVINTGILSMAMDLTPTRNSLVGGRSAAEKNNDVKHIDFQNFEKSLRSEILKFTRISKEDYNKEEDKAGVKIASFLGIKLF